MMLRGQIEAKAADRDMLAAAYANFKGEPTPLPTAKPVDQVTASSSCCMKEAVKRSYSRRKAGLERPAYTAKRKQAFEIIKRELEGGARFSQAYKAAGVSKITARKMCAENNYTVPEQRAEGIRASIELRVEKARLGRNMKAPLLRVYVDMGYSKKAAAEAMGISAPLVARIAEENGITFNCKTAK